MIESFCINCNKQLRGRQGKFCSIKCKSSLSNKIYQTAAKQKERGIKRKIDLVNMLGGKCSVCEYKKNLSALEFHHVNPLEKDEGLDLRKLSNCTWEFCLNEIKKCILLCSNCHREHHHPSLENFTERF